MTTHYDTETFLISNARPVPPLVCISWCVDDSEPELVHVKDPAAYRLVRDWFDKKEYLVGHNIAYDNAVLIAQWPEFLEPIFDAYDADLMGDTLINQQLHEIRFGMFRGRMVWHEDVRGYKWHEYKYGLADISRRNLGRVLEKDEWRLRYGEFADVPLDQWPEGARHYPKEDARATRDNWLKQEYEFGAPSPDLPNQMRAAWWLHLMSAYGLRTDAKSVQDFIAKTESEYQELESELKTLGLVKKDGTRDTKAAKAYMRKVCEENKKTLLLTDKGDVSLSADACERSDDDIMADYGKLGAMKTLLSDKEKSVLTNLQNATIYPVHTHFGLAESGRTTSSNPQIQNLRREAGIRECFRPRPGYVYADADYSALELYCLAQACIDLLGKSHLAEVLNAGLDPHTALGADIMGISYEEGLALKESGDDAFDNARQTAKVANFGFPGGLGFKKLVLFARKSYGVIITEERARELKNQWLARWPEMAEYFAYVNSLFLDGEETCTVTQLKSGRERGGCSYCAAANTHFQGLGADATKHAGWLIAKACYIDKSSVLYGSRPVAYVHDQWLVEVLDDEKAHDKAYELARLMKVGADKYLSEVPTKVSPLLARMWSNDAKAVFKNGRLVPWEG